jgi:hypothetical protein
MPYGAHESVTVDSTAGGVALTAATIIPFNRAVLTVETAAIRYTVDGTAPTTAVGHLAQPGDVIKLAGNDELTRFRAIRQGGVSGTIMASYGTGGS